MTDPNAQQHPETDDPQSSTTWYRSQNSGHSGNGTTQPPPQNTSRPERKQRNTVGLIALIIAVVGFVFACIPGALIVGWILLPISFILSIVGLAMSGKTKGTSISALIISVVGFIVGVLVFLFAVGSAFDDAFDDEVSVSDPGGESSAPVDQESTDESEDQDSTGDAEGSRSNPVDIGSTISSSDWDITVDGFDRDATDEVLTTNQFNEAPSDGNSYALAEVAVTYTGDDSEFPWADIAFAYVTEDGNTVNAYDVMAVTPDPDFSDIEELYEGASDSGNVLLEVPQEDNGVLRVTPGTLSDDVFVATE